MGEDIAFALENSCVPQKEMHEITRHAAELVGIENRLDHAPHELSGGQKQRVSLAGVMVDQVKILMFDEPLASLDPATGKQAIELIDEIQHKTDTTVLIIEHRLEDVLWRNVDRIILVNEGTILADLRPDELLATHMLAENGIREPLYLTAMRYAGIAITPEKRPAHVDTVVLDDADTACTSGSTPCRCRNPPPHRSTCWKCAALALAIPRGRAPCMTSAFPSAKARWSALWGATARANLPWQS